MKIPFKFDFCNLKVFAYQNFRFGFVAAQLSEWNLIFYGTETAPGAAQDTVAAKPGVIPDAGAHFGGDNALDAVSTGGKWREVTQRTGMTSENVDLPSRDPLSSGCSKPSDACLGLCAVFLLLTLRSCL